MGEVGWRGERARDVRVGAWTECDVGELIVLEIWIQLTGDATSRFVA
jgi:hypothetical protein